MHCNRIHVRHDRQSYAGYASIPANPTFPDLRWVICTRPFTHTHFTHSAHHTTQPVLIIQHKGSRIESKPPNLIGPAIVAIGAEAAVCAGRAQPIDRERAPRRGQAVSAATRN